MADPRWTKDQLKQAFYLYCQLPFGKLHSTNPEIAKLASRIGRTPSAVAMKLVNFASLDPTIRSSGRKGLSNASVLDRDVWNEFNANWERLALEAGIAAGGLDAPSAGATFSVTDSDLLSDYTGSTKRSNVEIRIKQDFFRASVLSSYQDTCCMSGISDPRLLTASHIVPWSVDPGNRLNPRNGLCLSALHDRAFDRGLIAITPKFEMRISRSLKETAKDEFLRLRILPLAGQKIRLPEKFHPDPLFLQRHFDEVFLGD